MAQGHPHGGARNEPLAIIGMGCRFPGAGDPARFWQLLRNGVDAISEVPPERFDIDAIYDPRPARPGKTPTRWGAFLKDVDLFDLSFFGISPREASRMDPQQRVLLEVAWEALEDAGLPVEKLAGSRAGVFIGACATEYERTLARDFNTVDIYSITGITRSVLSGRLSYAFDLQGPSLTVDTACSSALVAVHLACQSLWAGECTLALAGGVNIILTPGLTIGFSQANMMARDGRCKVFDARGDGFVRGDGIGLVVLKPLAQAMADHDPIAAVVLGGAVNNDGRTSGLLMMPGRRSQEDVIREAYRRAGVAPGSIQYVEAHGTGTTVGDPIEVQALGTILAEGRAPGQPCAIGSVKSNMGHAEGAAGIVGFMKAVLCLANREIPPTLHVQELNPRIPWDRLPLVVQRELGPWPETAAPARAGVSSFGISGTNAHLVLEEAPRRPAIATPAAAGPYLLPLSARSAEALSAMAARCAAFVAEGGASASLYDLGHSASLRRSHHDYRLAAVVHSHEELASSLAGFATGDTAPGVASGVRDPGRPAKLAFVFAGQGPQWWGMARELLRDEPVFRAAVEECDAILSRLAGWSLLDELLADEGRSRVHETEVSQPALFAVGVGLAALLRAWGVEPDAVVGHSVGEAAAAYVAGALSLEDAVRVVYHRGRLMNRMTGRGRMAAVGLPRAEAEGAIAGHEDRVSVGASNSPSTTVLSGDPDALEAILWPLDQRGVFVRYLPVQYAFHSPQMESLQDELMQALADIAPRPPTLPIFSTLTGAPAEPGDYDAAYWVRHLREPVLFADAVDRLADDGHDVYLELSPSPTLLGAVTQCLSHRGETGTVIGSLKRDEPDRVRLLGALGALYTAGRPLDWARLYPAIGRFVRLPSYPWQRERCWFENPADARRQREWSSGGDRQHVLLGRRWSSAHPTWGAELQADGPLAYLADHRVQDTALFPGTGYVEMALAAAAEAFPGRPVVLSDVEFKKALVVSDEAARLVQTVVVPEGASEAALSIYVAPDDGDEWTCCAQSRIRLGGDPGAGSDLDGSLADIRARCATELTGEDLYAALGRAGLRYGPGFRGIERAWVGDGEAVGRLVAPAALGADLERYRVHPALLDACLHVIQAAMPESDRQGTFLPVGIAEVRMRRALGSSAWSHARIRKLGRSPEMDITVFDDEGRIAVELRGFRLQLLEAPRSRGIAARPDEWLYELTWQAAPVEGDAPRLSGSAADAWIVLADADGIGDEIARRLADRGHAPVLVRPGLSFERLDDGSFRIELGCPDGFAKLFETLGAAGGLPCRGVVHLWAAEPPGADGPTADRLNEAQELGCVSALHAVQALAAAAWSPAPRLWLVTRASQHAGGADPVGLGGSSLWGLGRVVAHEHPELRCASVDLSAEARPDEIAALVEELCADREEDQLAFRGGDRYVARLTTRSAGRPAPAEGAEIRLELPAGAPARLEIPTPGLIDNLAIRPIARRAPGPGEIEIRVVAAGLNFRDVMKAMGIYPSDREDFTWLGDECAGTVVRVGAGVTDLRPGDDVIAIGPACFGTHVTTYAALAVAKPASLSFEDAVTVPVAFSTAYYALCELGRLARGERVLIHSGAGGVGLAAVQIARWVGAEIFATAGSPEKRAYLSSIGVHHVMDSRSLAFADEVRVLTEGRGVDVVLNSLAGDAIPKSLSVLGPGGRFLEIGKRDIYQNSKLGLLPFQNNLSFFAISMDRIYDANPGAAAALLGTIMQRFAAGDFTPLPRQAFALEEAVSAFRHMAHARHIGKVVLTVPDVEAAAPADPAARFRADGTYLVTGGLGSLGLRVARWMVERGARHLVLTSRRGPSADARPLLDGMGAAGAQVVVHTADVADPGAVAALLAKIDGAMPPLRGIVHAAGVLDDGILLQQDRERFLTVMAPKVRGAWNLHVETARRPLDFFVLFSSASSVLGNPGQGNYAAANAFMDALAHHRRARGLPALCVNWGAWSEVGMAAHLTERLAGIGIGSIPPDEGCALLEPLLASAGAQVAVLPIDWPRWAQFDRSVGASPLLSLLVERRAGADGTGAIRDALLAAAPSSRQALLEAHLLKEVARVLQIDPARLDAKKSLNRLGLDSLMGLELKNRVETDLGVSLPMTGLAEGPSISRVAAQLLPLLDAAPTHTA